MTDNVLLELETLVVAKYQGWKMKEFEIQSNILEGVLKPVPRFL